MPNGQFDNSSFDVRQQNRLFDNKGDYVDWYPGRKCSCTTIDLDTHHANPNCRVCKGLGYIYRASQPLLGIVTGITNQKIQGDLGIFQPGDLIFSQRMMDPQPLTDGDKIVLTWDGQAYIGDLVLRGDGNTDLLIFNATDITEVLQMDPIAGTTTVFTEGIDFLHPANSDQLVWQNSSTNQPAANSVYSVKYQAIYDWVVFTSPAQRYERGTPLGNRVYLRRKDMVIGKS
jgi:hypothetical protein